MLSSTGRKNCGATLGRWQEEGSRRLAAPCLSQALAASVGIRQQHIPELGPGPQMDPNSINSSWELLLGFAHCSTTAFHPPLLHPAPQGSCTRDVEV